MSVKPKEYPLNTVESKGDYLQLKKAFQKPFGYLYSVPKTREKKNILFKNQEYNKIQIEKYFERIYLKLKDTLDDKLPIYWIKISFILEYDSSTYKILKLKNINVNFYHKVGKLLVDEYVMETNYEPTNIDLFYSPSHADTEKIIEILNNIKSEYNENIINIILHNWDTEEGKNAGYKYQIEKVPTVQIDDLKLISPKETEIRNALTKAFVSNIKVSNERFEFES